MAGNIVNYSTQIQPAQNYNIAYINVNGQIRQKNSNSTTNFQYRLTGTAYKEDGTSSTSQIKINLTVADQTVDRTNHSSKTIALQSFTTSSRTFDTGWVDSGLSHTSGTDIFIFQFSGGGETKTGTNSGKIWNV